MLWFISTERTHFFTDINKQCVCVYVVLNMNIKQYLFEINWEILFRLHMQVTVQYILPNTVYSAEHVMDIIITMHCKLYYAFLGNK